MTLAAFDASSSSSAVTGSNVTSAGGNGLVVTRTGIAYFLDTIAREPAMQNYECGQDQLANRLLQQALIGFVSPKLINLLTAFGKYLLTKLRGKPWTKDKFKVELKFIRNVYYQGLLWIAVPYFPLMAFLMPILLILEFKFDYAFLKRLCNKTTSPFQGDLPAFLYFHIVTLLVFVGLWSTSSSSSRRQSIGAAPSGIARRTRASPLRRTSRRRLTTGVPVLQLARDICPHQLVPPMDRPHSAPLRRARQRSLKGRLRGARGGDAQYDVGG